MSCLKPLSQKPFRKPIGIGNAAEQEAFLNANPARMKAIENLYATARRFSSGP